MMSKDKWNMFWKNSDFPFMTKLGYGLEKKAIYGLMRILGVSKGAKIIDFGCGEGRTLSYLRELGFKNSIGIDTSKDAIKNCYERRGFKINKDVFLANRNTKYKCDIIFSQGLLEHYLRKDWDAIIKNMVNGKIIILMQPLTRSLLFRFAEYLNKKFSNFLDYVNEYDYEIEDFLEAFKKFGFTSKMIRTTHGLPKSLDTSIFIVLEKSKI